MDKVLVLIAPPIVGVITYIVVQLISKHAEIDVLRRREQDENGAREAVRRRDRAADGSLTETGRVNATLNNRTA